MGLAQFLSPGTLPAQLDQLISTLAVVADELAKLREVQQAQPTAPDVTSLPIVVSSRDQGAGIRVSDLQLTVTKLLVSATLTGRYSLQIGNDTTGLPFLLQANVPTNIDVPGITITRGLPFTLNVFPAGSGGPAGTPSWDMVLWATPGTARGAVA